MADSRTILHEFIPVDDAWHTIEVGGPIVHVATRSEDYVEIWFIQDPAVIPQRRTYRVFGTGHPDVEGAHVGSAITPSGNFVWHLMERGGGADRA